MINSLTLVDNGAGSTVILDTIQDIRISASPTEVYVAAGGSIEAIESKYKITNEQKANITKA